MRDVIRPGCANLVPIHRGWMFSSRGEWWGNQTV